MFGNAMERVGTIANKLGLSAPQFSAPRRMPGESSGKLAAEEESPIRKLERQGRAQEREEYLHHYRNLGEKGWKAMSDKELSANLRDYRRVLLDKAYDEHILQADRTTAEARGKFNVIANMRQINSNPEKFPTMGKHSMAVSKQMSSLELFDQQDGELMFNLTRLAEARVKDHRRSSPTADQR